jgi:hypothetical protein
VATPEVEAARAPAPLQEVDRVSEDETARCVAWFRACFIRDTARDTLHLQLCDAILTMSSEGQAATTIGLTVLLMWS